MNYLELNLKLNKSFSTMEFNMAEIKVLNYLPIRDKYDLITIALQKAEEDGIYNELKLDMYFHLYLVYLYTDIVFTPEDKQDEEELYDVLYSSGLIDKLVSLIDEEEYNFLVDMMTKMKEEKLQYSNTAAAVIKTLVQDLPKNAEAAAKMVDEFDPQKYEQVVNFARSAGAVGSFK